MNYNEALQFIHESHKFGMRLGLDNIKKLLELLGDPQNNLKIIHVAGTNGKGSTCSFISSILKESGYKVGLYTSPFLETFTERIRVNGENISEEEVGKIVSLIKEKIEIMVSEGYSYPTEFEIVTAMAFYYYNQEKVDFVALEVGLGGRYDATNVIDKPVVSAITSISLDHTGILGDTLAKIAFEKGGIIKENCPTIVYPQQEEASEVIKNICAEKKSKYIECDFKNIEIKSSNINSQIYNCNINGKELRDLEIKLIGDHQIKNSIVALNVIEYLNDIKITNISEENIRKGLLGTKWPGRIEKISENPMFIIDGAHNEEGAKSLANSIDKYFENKNKILVIGMLEDKDIDSVLDLLIPKFNKVITTTPDNPRAIDANKLKEKIERYNIEVTCKPNIKEAVDYALEISNKDDVIISAGSLYMIGNVRTIIVNK
ncbi:bifunctional folylpolyglutamate synthase/dihydrofolate synthase [Paraclostridium bifermentans]|uniref:bifunctional folylpolyglutamate synthase/dihydrofolate synthase n=1 Tax=Paraclostridium bifermentans TaxID=1490 RepID=UPI0021C2F24C|nr:folylpolyglutamate synthase/dihydrofolate synthase family protein [Paraclostridium bifermentans]MDV8111814.1 folylpolyglutamate synthase/dihydrofolate synthase family protein [Bacillus sp. BAU-SS-2023]GKZ02391.1 bifunctional folylpolyglutamate synthase/dihydrofolate synthase [Paraclostridium bifermentans]GKZ05841.1 bifunctional folylpolyglutamate synthase/dihydrofolate synthase [Paraclostridium bifermentans]GKZ08687.1 bifunctional folylpolyglutamate synthase/dihydrofolate synthase [Paraclost